MSGMKRLLPLLLLAALAPAWSQTSALRGHNSDAPVDVAADRIEVQDRADRAIISGNVVVRQA
ncbi:MAG TPA: OstA family protein, partial [Allosphingosinicella sp.]